MQRSPAVAGMFYEATPERLRKQVADCFAQAPRAGTKEPFLGAIVPHAGLMYSGHVAAALYERVEIPNRMIILSPNHTGLGRGAAINRDGAWSTPLGVVQVDEELARELCDRTSELVNDTVAHAREHSLEVQLPFIQTIAPDARFVPICLKTPRYELCVTIGEAIAEVVARHRAAGEPIPIIASSDMNHYETQTATLEKDQKAIDAILALDPRRLWETVMGEDISMCGIIPATTMLVAANALGASRAELVRHATSGDINHDYSSVVGYASLIIS
jgi:AmmeMemoRadiSam system protein B